MWTEVIANGQTIVKILTPRIAGMGAAYLAQCQEGRRLSRLESQTPGSIIYVRSWCISCSNYAQCLRRPKESGQATPHRGEGLAPLPLHASPPLSLLPQLLVTASTSCHLPFPFPPNGNTCGDALIPCCPTFCTACAPPFSLVSNFCLSDSGGPSHRGPDHAAHMAVTCGFQPPSSTAVRAGDNDAGSLS